MFIVELPVFSFTTIELSMSLSSPTGQMPWIRIQQGCRMSVSMTRRLLRVCIVTLTFFRALSSSFIMILSYIFNNSTRLHPRLNMTSVQVVFHSLRLFVTVKAHKVKKQFHWQNDPAKRENFTRSYACQKQTQPFSVGSFRFVCA